MAFKKNSSKITITQTKQVREAVQKAKGRPWLALGIIASVPVLFLLVWTVVSGPKHGKPAKNSTKTETILIRQTPQELAEEATTALRKGDTEAFLDLLGTKIKDPNITNSYGDSLLLAAATLGNVDAVQQLLAMGADVNKQNYNTRDTAVLRSIAADHDEITRLLVYEHADLNIPNNYRQTPMGLAVEKQKGELVDLFLANGVKAGLTGDTLFRAVAQKNLVGVWGMLKGGVDPNITNEKSNTPLIISASLGDTDSVRALLAYRADVNKANNDGNTPLIYAARYNHPNTVLALTAPLTMQYRVDLDAQNKRGETALYWAAQKGYPAVVKILLAYDADKNIKTTAGLTALDAAKKYNRQDVITLLTMNINQLKESFNQQLQAQQQAQEDAQEEVEEAQ